jgi:hypothetical protein
MNCFHRISGSLRLLGLSIFIALATVSTSSADQYIQLGANAAGVVTVSQSGSVYTLRFDGDETIQYQIDLSQPLVAQGLIRVYEASSDCWPRYDAALGYRDGNGLEHSIGFISGYATLTGQSMTSDSVILDFTDDFTSFGEGIRHRRTTFRLHGKMLSIRVQDMDQSLSYRRNYIGVLPGTSEGFDSPQILPLMGAISTPTIHFRNGSKHYYFSDILDFANTNASDYGQSQNPKKPGATTTSLAYNFQTWDMYKPLSDNQSIAAPVDDTFQITISSTVSDTFVTPTHTASPYRTLLTDRMVLLLGSNIWANYPPLWNQLDQWGMDNIAGYFFDWTAELPDPPSPTNVGPDWWPPVDPSGFTTAMLQGVAKGYLLGAYNAFNLMPTSAPVGVYDPSQIARDQNGAPKMSLQYAGIPAIASTASGLHAASEGASLHSNAGASMAYLDVQTYASPTRGADADHVDQTVGSPWAKTLKQAIADQQTWMRDMQDLFQGPLLGEGSINGYGSNYEFLWAGYCDSTQCVLNTGSGIPNAQIPNTHRGKLLSPTGWPVTPEIEWRIFAPLQVNHGNGFPERFFSPPDGPSMVTPAGLPIYPMTTPALDRYRIFELTYGKSGFAQSNGLVSLSGSYMSNPDLVREYHMTNALQARYTQNPPTRIEYLDGGAFKGFQRIVEVTNSLDSFRDPKIRLTFANGLVMWLNHNAAPWNVTANGIAYTIPEDGFVAAQPSTGFVCFSAIPPGTGGNRIDYCLAPESYEFFDGRGVVGGYGGQSTSSNGASWTAFTRGRTFHETGIDTIVQVGPSSPPTLLHVEVRPPSVSIPALARVGFQAFAIYSNGSQRDVTKLVTWSTGAPSVATVNNGAALTAINPGQTTVSVSAYQGAPVVPATVTVH